MIDLVPVALGFALGVVGTFLAMEVGMRRIRNREESKLTNMWSLSEVLQEGQQPRIVATRIEGLTVPRGARVILPRGVEPPPEILRAANVRVAENVDVNFAVGREAALVFASHVHPRTLAVWTVDKPMLARLASEFKKLWDAAEPFTRKYAIADLAGKPQGDVEVGGVVLDAAEKNGRYFLRVQEQGHLATVVTQDDMAHLKGTAVRILGRLESSVKEPIVLATKVEKARAPAAAR
ncbi:MAG TPA: hypothetical protein VM681_08110 [Candidatus Thermoplasmatota archaeon]|nr:hypothetical protein [Candidatus Thermoplasmatota archaeon]